MPSFIPSPPPRPLSIFIPPSPSCQCHLSAPTAEEFIPESGTRPYWVGGQTWRQHIPVVSLSQPVGNALNHSEGEKERKKQPPKYSLALGLSKRPSAGGLATHTEVQLAPSFWLLDDSPPQLGLFLNRGVHQQPKTTGPHFCEEPLHSLLRSGDLTKKHTFLPLSSCLSLSFLAKF